MVYTNKLSFFFILLLVSIVSCFAQDNNRLVVEYSFKGINSFGLIQKTELLVDKDYSIHVYSKRKGRFSEDMENLKFEITIPTPKRLLYYKNLSKRNLIKRAYIFTKLFIVKDSIPKITWQLYDEEKTIANTYVCKKAIGEFRGRIYTVWFTEQIPISNGPWKLGGLPGLILEAYDEDKEVVFEFVSLKRSNDDKDFKKEIENIDTTKTISWEEYARLFRKKIKELAPFLQSQVSGDVTVNLTNVNLIEKSILEDEN